MIETGNNYFADWMLLQPGIIFLNINFHDSGVLVKTLKPEWINQPPSNRVQEKSF